MTAAFRVGMLPSLASAPSSWVNLDAELGRWLDLRTSLHDAAGRPPSALDEVADHLRRLRTTLAFTAGGIDDGDDDDARTQALVSRAYRWSIRVARELEAIEHLELEPVAEWSRFEAFAPFALAFFDSVLGAPFADAPATRDVLRLRRDLDAVLAPLTMAMTSSALAA
jgi:hypothetical protein